MRMQATIEARLYAGIYAVLELKRLVSTDNITLTQSPILRKGKKICVFHKFQVIQYILPYVLSFQRLNPH